MSSITEAVNINQNPFILQSQYNGFVNLDLPHNANLVNTIYQDSMGMIWIGTKNGLFSYDGYRTQDYITEYGSEANSIFAIIQIDSTHLCLGTDSGLLIFNFYTEQYEKTFPGMDKIRAVRSLKMFYGKLWIGSRDNGLFSYDFVKELLTKEPLKEGVDETVVYAIEPAHDNLFVGTYQGLSCYNIHNGDRTIINLPKQLMVNSLLWDKERSCVWIGTEGYLFQYFPDTGTLESKDFLHKNSFKFLSLDGKKNLLAGTDDGLYVYSPSNNITEHIVHDSRNTQSLCNNIIWCVFRDKENNIWLGTDHGCALSLYNTFFKYTHISELTNTGDGNQFTVSYVDSRGNYWLGGVNGLVLIERNISLNHKYKVRWFRLGDNDNPLSHNRIRCIYEDRDHNIWIATDGSILRYDLSTLQFIHYTITDKSGQRNANWAYDIYEDGQGRLWIASYMGGLFVVNKKKLISQGNKRNYCAEYCFSETTRDLATVSNIIYRITVDKSNQIWAGTQNGLVRINPKTMDVDEIFEISDAGVKNIIYLENMVCDFNGYLWISSQGQLCRINTRSNKIEHISLPLPKQSQIYSLVIENNNLWISSSEGICNLNCKTFQAWLVPVPKYYYQTGFYDALHELIIWGGKDGLISMTTDVIGNYSKTNNIVITSIWAKNKRLRPGVDYKGNSVRFQNDIRLAPSYNNLSIEFSEFIYSHELEGPFFYRLHDFDKEWQKLEAGQNRVSFAHLAPGDYTLSIRNGLNGNSTFSPITDFKFTISPPWYLSLTARFIYIVLFCLFFFVVLKRVQMNSKRRYEQMEKEKSLELSSLKIDFFTNISHELKTPLSLIIAPLSRLIAETRSAEQKQKLELIHQNSLLLNTLIHKILDFRHLEHENDNVLIRSHVELCSLFKNILKTFTLALEEKKIQSVFSTNTDTIWMNVDILKIESLFLNIISNAVRFMPASGGKISITLENNSEVGIVSITVSDEGPGIKHSDLPFVFVRFFQSRQLSKDNGGTGIGLYLVKKYVELHDGTVNISSQEGKGTTVSVVLPLNGENSTCINSTYINNGDGIKEIASESNKGMRPTLLIVDDNIEILSFMELTFSDDYICLKALNGKEGLTIASENKPDLMIVDQMMPEMSGLELCRKLRLYQPTASIPVIMLTAKDDLDTEIESIKAGANVFMVKPFDINRLMFRMKQLLQARHLIERDLRIENITCPADIADIESPDEKILIRITKTIEDHIEDTSFSVMSLSVIIGIDLKQLYRKLKLLTGITPVNYIRQIRMKKAAMLLSQGKFTVSEVMYMVGYSNASYFSKCFVMEFGVSPKQYIAKNNL